MTDPTGPLADLTVLDLSSLLPGPFATGLLADLGARVTKVERPGGDPMRRLAPHTYPLLNARKEVVEIDLATPAGRDRVLALARGSDLVVESFRPGALDRLGLGAAHLRAANDQLVVLSLSGFGQTGPAAGEPGHDATYLARAGTTALGAAEGHVPGHGAVQVADLGAALYAVIAALAATRAPRGVRAGQHLDVSLFGAALALSVPRLAEYAAATSERRRDLLRRPAHGAFRAADGRWLVIAAVEDQFWVRTCAALGLDELAARPDLATYAGRMAHADHVDEAVAAVVATRPAREWEDVLRAADVPVSVVQTPEEVAQDAQVRELGALGRWPEVTALTPIRGWSR